MFVMTKNRSAESRKATANWSSIFLSLVVVVVVVVVVVCHGVPCSGFAVRNRGVEPRRFCSLGSTSCVLFATPSSKRIADSSSNKNTKHRAIEMLEFLKARYSSSEDGSSEKSKWKKVQMYLYRSHQRIPWEQMEEVVNFLDERVPKSTSRRMLQTAPRILRKSVDSFLEPNSEFLKSLWGPELFQQAMDRNPKLLLMNGVGYTQRTREAEGETVRILTEVGGLSLKATRQLKKNSPFVFALPSAKVLSVCEYILLLLQSGADDVSGGSSTSKQKKTLARILVNHPFLLNLSVEKNLKPRMEYIQSACQMNTTEIAKMVQSSTGTILALSIEDNLKPTLQLLKSILMKSGNESFRKILLSHPQILSLSMSNVRAKVELFDSLDLKYSPPATRSTSRKNETQFLASRILSRCPAVYSLSLKDNIIPKVDFLSKVWCVNAPGIENDPVSLSSQLQEFPNILTMSLDGNIRPTLNFYNRTGYTSLSADWQLLPGATRIPGRYMAASLYNRLLPRWHFCLSKKHTTVDESGEHPYKNAPSLHLLVLSNDAKFCVTLGLDLGEYSDFKEGAIPRLKFSSQFDTWLKTGRPIQV